MDGFAACSYSGNCTPHRRDLDCIGLQGLGLEVLFVHEDLGPEAGELSPGLAILYLLFSFFSFFLSTFFVQ